MVMTMLYHTIPIVKFTEFKVVNVLAVCTMPFQIRLPEFTKSNRPLASYEPELHPAALYRIKDIKATLQVFSTGSITVTVRFRSGHGTITTVTKVVHDIASALDSKQVAAAVFIDLSIL
ncbi:TATA box-binding protein-like protein 1 [Acipenser ruthenus]|uniref:TATA box-binding protein-like protein 1 n=1 Tax=Acipenser ruthenus TaxID=7906 RepID=A0A444UL25_ACIRT|nr:TATA box-binding protein-like protein 1 [Acipenser ruthenus]